MSPVGFTHARGAAPRGGIRDSGTLLHTMYAPYEYIADVVAVGDAVEGIEIGDVVKYSEHADGIEMKHEGDDVLLMNYDMIFAKIVSE